MLLVFGAVFAGAGVFAFVTTTDIGADGVIGGVVVAFGGFFLMIFGGFGVLMMLLGLYLLTELLGRGNPERPGDRPPEFLSAVQAHGPL